MKIAYLGPKNTFTEKVTRGLFPEKDLIPIDQIGGVIQAVEKSEVDYGVVPLENFYEGMVLQTIDALSECSNTRIIRETSSLIVHCFGTLPNHENITHVFSKDQALNQCVRYLARNYPHAKTIQTGSTAEAALRIRDDNLLYAAAIGPEKALTEAGLEVLARDICPNNKTRFAVLGREVTQPTGDDKTFLMFRPLFRDKPRTLVTCLDFLSNLDINLDFVTSRPDGVGGYSFYVEFAGHEKDEPVKMALESLRYSLDKDGNRPETMKVLGSYKNTDWKGDDLK